MAGRSAPGVARHCATRPQGRASHLGLACERDERAAGFAQLRAHAAARQARRCGLLRLRQPEENLCSPYCPCAAGGCRATGVQYPLELRSVGEGVGVGVFAKTRIPRGVLVAPYVGEVTNDAKADAQFHENASSHFYFLDLEADFWSRLRTPDGVAVIDGAHFSNMARYFNHSCSPNLGRAAVDWPGLEAGPLVFLYAADDIDPGTE